MPACDDDVDDDDEDGLAAWLEREALHRAAGEGDLARVKALLAEGYPIDRFDDLSWTPLHHAARNEHLEVVRHLIAAGADVNAHEEQRIGDTVLKHVAPSCSLDLARMLVDAGADPTIPGWMGLTALDKSEDRKSRKAVPCGSCCSTPRHSVIRPGRGSRSSRRNPRKSARRGGLNVNT